jgi:hypothetical protein
MLAVPDTNINLPINVLSETENNKIATEGMMNK